jgi:cytidine kinase
MSILAVGTLAFDTIETPTDRRERILGGSGTFFSFAASHFVPVRLVGMVGNDWPLDYSRLLEDRGIDLSGVSKRADRKTYFWHGRYHSDFQERDTLAWESHGFEHFHPTVPAAFRSSRFVYLGAATPSVQLRLLDQCASPECVFADTVDAWIETARDDLLKLMARVDCFFINQSEAVSLSGHSDLHSAIRWIQDQGPKTVVLKLGKHGSILLHSDRLATFEAKQVQQVVDPTGAGDSFAGGMVGYLATKEHIDFEVLSQSIQVGTEVASYTIQGFSIEGLARYVQRS